MENKDKLLILEAFKVFLKEKGQQLKSIKPGTPLLKAIEFSYKGVYIYVGSVHNGAKYTCQIGENETMKYYYDGIYLPSIKETLIYTANLIRA